MLGDHLQRLSVPFKHGEEEQGKHGDNHGHRGQTHVAARLLYKEKQRDADQRRRAEAQKLPLGQVENDLGFDPRQIARDRNISSHLHHLLSAGNRLHRLIALSSVGTEHAPRKASRLEQGEAKQHGISHHPPD